MLLDRQFHLLVTQHRQGAGETAAGGVRHDDVVDVAALGGDERRQASVAPEQLADVPGACDPPDAAWENAFECTLLASLLDFTDTGAIGLFVDEQSVALRESTIGGPAGGLMRASTFTPPAL